MINLPQPTLFSVVHVEAQHLRPRQIVSRPRGPLLEVMEVADLGAVGVLVRGRDVDHAGLVEIGCSRFTTFEVHQ
ncbi:hypothetical protein ACFORJ_06215 [Corynebacterium hansenii]|uniref:Uncharacterized protein n=1 Tax=Corynebacterium hansenii TaxID=394964 RepID=A0ABV7ZR71_9CORY|nr:hypothetical protein [Corynebacterium hansenii]WJZ00340.1 hypothetical protein CHAN_08660 [Corynebacterium hansenii]